MGYFSLLFTLNFLPVVLAATCYWPNGRVADGNYLQCPDSKHCCAETEACLSNGLCVAGKLMTVYRGACADKSWPKSGCPHVCHEEIPDQWANLYSCPSNDNEVFTCGTAGWSSSVCEDQLGNYTWVSGNITVAQLGVSSPSPSATSTSETASTTSSSTDTSGPTASDANSSAGKNSNLKMGLGLGLGLGLPFILAMAGLLSFYMHTRRQIQSLQRKLDEKGSDIIHPGPPDRPAPPPQELETTKHDRPELQ